MNSLLQLKSSLIKDLSKIDSVIFVGGASEYIQGFRNELNDIDISIEDPKSLFQFGYVFRSYNNSIYGLSGHRAFLKIESILIDVFVDPPRQYIKVGEYRCETIESMLQLSKNTLRYHADRLSSDNYYRLIQRIKRLESHKKEPLIISDS